MLDNPNIMKSSLKFSFHYKKVPDNILAPNSTLETVIEITLNFIILFTFIVIMFYVTLNLYVKNNSLILCILTHTVYYF